MTPGTRPAWPSVAGRTSRSRCRTSVDRPRTCRIVEVLRQAQLFMPALPLDFERLPIDVTRVLREHVDLQGNLLDEPLVCVGRAHPLRLPDSSDCSERGVGNLWTAQQIERVCFAR